MQEMLENEVANPKHPNYQNYMTNIEIDDFVSCGEPTRRAKEDLSRWLVSNGIRGNQIHATNSYIRVHKATVAQIETLFNGEVEMRFHQNVKTGTKLLRARGYIGIPQEIAEHVVFISGLTELQDPVKHMKKNEDKEKNKAIAAATAGHPDATGPFLISLYDDLFVTPRVVRRLYNLRQNLSGGTAASNSMAIAAFGSIYYEDDLCYAFDLFAKDAPNGALYPMQTTVNYNGGTNDQLGNTESSLDIQYITMMATNVSTAFWNHEPGVWILGWAQEAINITTSNGPWVWSISYGLTEIFHCLGEDAILCTDLGLNYMSYIQTTNTELMKLGMMGVTVFVSSGDNGAPGTDNVCPVDPAQKQFGKLTCPAANAASCKCGSIFGQFTDFGINCIWQAGGGASIGGLSDCAGFIQQDPQVLAFVQQWTASANATCPSLYDAETFTFGSTCTCDQLPTITYNYILNATTGTTSPLTISGYQFDPALSSTVFGPAYPGTSPYVVSVGATRTDPLNQVGACGQSTQEVYASIKSFAIISGGGGFSVVSPRPSWQSSFVSSYLQSVALPTGTFNSSNRGFPDIALNGHNYAVVNNRSIIPVDGTSASAPALAGMFALMNEVLLSNGKKPLGLLGPLLYQMATEEPAAFNKITSATQLGFTFGAGNNCTENYCCRYGYSASSSGWDPVTGLGTPNMMVIENYIRKINGLPSIAQEAAAAQAASSPSSSTTTTGKTVSAGGAVGIALASLVVGAVLAFLFLRARAKREGEGDYARQTEMPSTNDKKKTLI
eukprot:TRINITY_DN1790_c0_g2_i2.p1 TRINITY_DN1790_c0_g2~~TRINITY_DN1790_c0_g2_i2.p1  ORF type:complete len:888 (-),score=257.55 TRINITY_DN1790_c0_g2_i2:64-2406(-)